MSSVHDCEALQEELGRIYNWAVTNNMCFNGIDCQGSITFPYLTSEDTVIEAKSELTDLSVLMSSSGSFKRHVKEINNQES